MTTKIQGQRPVHHKPTHKAGPPPDANTAAVLAKLAKDNPKAGSISGQELADAINNATKDPSQSAGKEFDQIKKWVGAHGKQLSPEAKKVFDVYKHAAERARANGQTGIDFRAHAKMERDMQAASRPGYQDASASEQLNALAKDNKEPGSISGKEMADAIINGTKDLDGQAAGTEFADISKFVKENEQLLSPEAKNVFAIYEKNAKASKAKGDPGIPQQQFARMTRDMLRASAPKYQDASAAAALNALAKDNTKPGSISGEEMSSTIMNGIADLDDQAAGKEFADISKFVKENGTLLSPEAKKAFAVYEKYAKAAQAKGQTGIPQDQMARMGLEMKMVSHPGGPPPNIFVPPWKNWAPPMTTLPVKPPVVQLPPPGTYQPPPPGTYTPPPGSALPPPMWESPPLLPPNWGRDASAAAAVDGLLANNKEPGSISGWEMAYAIGNGIKDPDNQSAGKEFAEFQKLAKEHPELLSPEAKQVMATYTQFAQAAQAKGDTGIGGQDFTRMMVQMAFSAVPRYTDASAAASLFSLAQSNQTPGSISGEEMRSAIMNGIKDLDGQAAGNEFADIAKFVKENEQLLSPEAKKAFEVYAKYAQKAQASGQSGIPTTTLNQMDTEMGNAIKPPPVFQWPTWPGGMFPPGLPPGGGFFPPWMRPPQPPPPTSPGGPIGPGGPALPPPPPPIGTGPVQLPPWLFGRDKSAMDAVNGLLANNKGPGSVSGQEMADAIIKGTADLDNQSAGKEFAEFARFARQHGDMLSPEAKQVFATYEQHARSAMARGQTGIPVGEYMQMQLEMRAKAPPRYQDASAAAQLNALASGNKEPGSISGKEMADAIIQGTMDRDDQGAGKEFADISKFVKENPQLLSPEARQAFAVYEAHARAAQARGETGIDTRDFMRMTQELALVGRPRYQDAGAAAALTQLAQANGQPGSISGKEMTDSIMNAIRDPDNQAAGKEFADVSKFVRENPQLLSPEAKAAFAVYEKHAKAAQARGQTGIPTFEMMRMGAEMRLQSAPKYTDASAANQLNLLARTNTTPGSISGREMMDAINRSMMFHDGRGSAKELGDFQKFARENAQLLSPEAKKCLATYEKYAKDGVVSFTDRILMQREMSAAAPPVWKGFAGFRPTGK
jgi:hypothetical protein